jgi:nucleoside-diphosphate-sugar epimerase
MEMRVAVTGASGFLGRYIVSELVRKGHTCRCWHRPESDLRGFEACEEAIAWVPGVLNDPEASASLVEDCDAVVHAALDRPGAGFRGSEGELMPFLDQNFMGTIRLIEAARAAHVKRFVFISTCAVHEIILDDRALDEAHPLWPSSHYGAHKAAVEAFVHSYGIGMGYPICALRPTGIYGLAHPPQDSRWFNLIRSVSHGEDVHVRRGGKEVHAADVARAAAILLTAENVAGQSYNCYDRYISEFDVATLAKELSGSRGAIIGAPTAPKHQIVTTKLQALGMKFGGRPLLEQTIGAFVDASRQA